MRSAIGTVLTTPLSTWTGTRDHRERAGAVSFLLAVVVLVALNVFHLRQPLLEMHAFRQTQTAITSYWLQRNGFSMAYETPALGYPWSIPFEFPLYQWVVAWLATLTGLDLDLVGRLVNLVASVAVCQPLYRSLRLLGIDRGAAHYANAVFLTLPIYVFWSGTFLIEGMALLFTMWACYFLAKMYVAGPSRGAMAGYAAFFLLALLVKVTTAALPVLVGCVAFGARWLASLGRGTHVRSRQTLEIAVLALVTLSALGIELAWVHYTDVLKEQNAFGRLLTSSALEAWNYGSLELRFSERFRDVILRRLVLPSTASGLGLVCVAAVLALRGEGATRRAVALALLMFALPLMVFTNLHFVHDYYQFANALFLAVAVGCAVYALCGRLPAGARFLAPALMLIPLAANLDHFWEQYFSHTWAPMTPATHRTLRLAQLLNQQTRPDQSILVFGFEWSPELMYYARRKGLAAPAWGGLDLDVIRHPTRFLPAVPAAIVSCPTPTMSLQRAAIAARYPDARVQNATNCRIYFPAPQGR